MDGCHREALGPREREQLLAHLPSELARRDEDERARALASAFGPLDDRDCKGERLAGPRRRLREDVEPCESIGQDGGLDVEGLENRAGGELVDDDLRHAELAERLLGQVVQLLESGRDLLPRTSEGGTRSSSHRPAELPTVRLTIAVRSARGCSSASAGRSPSRVDGPIPRG